MMLSSFFGPADVVLAQPTTEPWCDVVFIHLPAERPNCQGSFQPLQWSVMSLVLQDPSICCDRLFGL